MRIVLLLAVLFVAAWLPATLAAGLPMNTTQPLDWGRHGDHPTLDQEYMDEVFLQRSPRFQGEQFHGAVMSVKQMQTELKSGPLSCCPSFREITQPDYGINQFGNLVTLMETNPPQTFYEYSCMPGVAGRACMFLDRRFHNQSECVQKRSFSYALVFNRTVNGVPDVHLDHIKVNSGCACRVVQKHHEKAHPKHSEKVRHKKAKMHRDGHHHKRLD